MEDFKELISQYSREAKRLYERRKELYEIMLAEPDSEKQSELELRIRTLDCERYEILSDIRAMMNYVGE